MNDLIFNFYHPNNPLKNQWLFEILDKFKSEQMIPKYNQFHFCRFGVIQAILKSCNHVADDLGFRTSRTKWDHSGGQCPVLWGSVHKGGVYGWTRRRRYQIQRNGQTGRKCPQGTCLFSFIQRYKMCGNMGVYIRLV